MPASRTKLSLPLWTERYAAPLAPTSAAEMAATFVLLLRLDVAFEEAAIASSRKMQERLRRMRSGEGAFLPSAARARRSRPGSPAPNLN